MKTKLIMIAMGFIFFTSNLWALTAREIMEKSDALTKPDTALMKIGMYIYKGKSKKEKEFIMQIKRDDNKKDKALISFVKPTRIKLLIHSNPNQDDDQWLRLSSGKVKRVVTSDKGKPFVNSHYCYEDLSSVNIDEFDFKLLGDAQVDKTTCFQIEAKKKEKKPIYSKLILYVRKADFYVMKIDFFKKGKHYKTLENTDIRKVKNILTPYKMVMARADGKGRTELNLLKLKYNAKIDDTKFSKDALR